MRGQGLVLFVLSLPVLFGFLGLAVDGGYYMVLRRAAQFAADAAARAAAVDVLRAQQGELLLYLVATNHGRTVGLNNLQGHRVSGADVEIRYNNSFGALSGALGWLSGLPTPLTKSVRARVSAQYRTLFLRFVGISTVEIEVAGAQPLAVASLSGVLPLGVCTTTTATAPLGPWTLWRDGSSLCGIPGWDGLVNLDGSADACGDYQAWVQPAPRGPEPPVGSVAGLDPRDCSQMPLWLLGSTGSAQLVVVVDSGDRTVVGCRPALIVPLPGLGPILPGSVTGVPVGPLTSCSGVVQVE
jgi:hypothetical protein